MRKLLVIVLLLNVVFANAQTDEEKLTLTLKEFHQSLVKKNTVSINQQTDKALSYGHSNGWVETKTELIKNLETGYTSYKSIKEDSLQVVINGNVANARFVGDYEVSLNGGNAVVYHLKVLEVWVKKGKRWLLFARQAVKSSKVEMALLKNGFYKLYEKEVELVKVVDKKEDRFYSVDSVPSIEIQRVKEVVAETNRINGRNYGTLNIVMTDLGAQQMTELTKKWKGNRMGLVIENELVFAAVIFEPIYGGEVAFASNLSNSELGHLAQKVNDSIKK
jgi:Domain of unknown function (DUF4440)